MGFSGKWVYLQDDFFFEKKNLPLPTTENPGQMWAPDLFGGIFGNKLNPYCFPAIAKSKVLFFFKRSNQNPWFFHIFPPCKKKEHHHFSVENGVLFQKGNWKIGLFFLKIATTGPGKNSSCLSGCSWKAKMRNLKMRLGEKVGKKWKIPRFFQSFLLTWPMAKRHNFFGITIFSGENKPFKRLYFRVRNG